MAYASEDCVNPRVGLEILLEGAPRCGLGADEWPGASMRQECRPVVASYMEPVVASYMELFCALVVVCYMRTPCAGSGQLPHPFSGSSVCMVPRGSPKH